jgi:purine-binding chemotaxis protein CheW
MTAPTISDSTCFCTFRVNDLLFGVEVQKVQEVLRSQPTTQVPLSPPVVHGLMNLRGQIVSALSLRERLGIASEGHCDRSMNIVVRSKDGPVSILVDEIGDVIRVDDSQFEPAPETLQGRQRKLTRGAYKLDDGLLLILDTERVIGAG